MGRWLFTVPLRWRDGGHPLGIGPDDVFMVEADREQDARLRVNQELGNGAWCSCYDVDHPDTASTIRRWHPGRVVDMTGTEVRNLWPDPNATPLPLEGVEP